MIVLLNKWFLKNFKNIFIVFSTSKNNQDLIFMKTIVLEEWLQQLATFFKIWQLRHRSNIVMNNFETWLNWETWSRNFILKNKCVVAHWNSPINNYMLKVYNRNSGKRCEICSKLRIKAICLKTLLTLKKFHTFSSVSNVDSELVIKQVNVCWVI